MAGNPLTYSLSGVNYDTLDKAKRLSQHCAGATAGNLRGNGQEVLESRGESAYVWEEADCYRALVVEGLGTKNLVADETRKITGKTYYGAIAQDTVAMIINDLITVGASPQVVNAYFAVGSSDWFFDEERASDLITGFAKACDLAGAVWGGGETPALKNIIEPNAIDLAGSAAGIIKPKGRLTLGDKIASGDIIFIIESSGVHANGLTLARHIATTLPAGYSEQVSEGKSYGESLLVPTHIYAPLIRDYFEAGIDIHYMVNITGHGWRKLMRAKREFSYIIESLPEPQPIFNFIQEHSGNDDSEMYGNFNMGAGFALFMPERYVELASAIAKNKHNLLGMKAGYVEKGEKQVAIKPKNIVFKADSLRVR